MSHQVFCVKRKENAEGLDKPPFNTPLGEKIFQNVSKQAWMGWLDHQKMLVNEYRLNLADPQARRYLVEQTERYFFGDGADVASGYVPLDKSEDSV